MSHLNIGSTDQSLLSAPGRSESPTATDQAREGPAAGPRCTTRGSARSHVVASIDAAVAALTGGRAVVVIDDECRENEGDLIFAAMKATPEPLAFMVRHTSGYVCIPMPAARCDKLELPPMFHTNQDRRGTAYAVTVDAREGITTGISAADRAHTIRILADGETTARDLCRPAHVVPLRAVAGGVLHRPGHTEAVVDLMVLAGLAPVGRPL